MAGIDRGTHYDWLQKDPVYRAKFERAQEVAIQALEDEAVRVPMRAWNARSTKAARRWA
jgi:hypothetical protein